MTERRSLTDLLKIEQRKIKNVSQNKIFLFWGDKKR
jgi:hypothetical protein